LWSYYADGDRGVCIGFETDLDTQCFQKLETVKYVDVLPKIKLLSHMKENLITLYTTKSKEWAHERETRAFQHACGNHSMNPECLVSIVFGERVSTENKSSILDIVNKEYGHRVKMQSLIRGEDNVRVLRNLAA